MGNWFKNDTIIKILSVILAIFLWATVVFVQNPYAEITVKNIPVNILGSDALNKKGLCVSNIETKEMNIKIRGLKRQLVSINASNIVATVDVSGISKENHATLPINIIFPVDNITILEKNPYQISMDFDDFAKITLPIDVVKSGENKDPSLLCTIDAQPKEITLEGPKTKISLIKTALVNVDISNIEKSVTFMQDFELLTSSKEPVNTAYVSKSSEKISVNCLISYTKTVPIIPSIVGVLPSNVTYEVVNTEPQSVKIAGLKEDIALINELYTNPIDISKYADKKDVSINTSLAFPPSIFLPNLAEPYAKVNILIKTN